MTHSLKYGFLHKPLLARLLLLPWCLLLGLETAAAATDVVEFINGDSLTGEAKSLERGRLQFDTDATGVINIEWKEVAFLKVDDSIQVEIQNGDRFFGPLRRAKNTAEILVETRYGPVTLQNDSVIGLHQIDDGGIRNIDLSVSLGYNFTKASNVSQFNVGLDAAYRTRLRILSGNFSSFLSDSSNNENSQRKTLGFNYTRLRANRWLNDGGISFDQNDELGLNLRSSLSAGGGRILVQSNTAGFTLKGGLKATRENTVDQPEDLDSIESYGIMMWEWFRYNEPTLDWSTSLEVIPSLTESGRVRAEFDAKLKWEMFSDFFWQLDFYESYDSDPPASGTAEGNDYGVTTSLSYDF